MGVKLKIVDGPNWFRIRAETDIMGSPVRNCFLELQHDPAHVIVVWDGRDGLARRRELYPAYKATRKKPGENIFESQDLLKKILRLGKCVQIEVPGYEGDDVIAAVAGRYRDHVDTIFIQSNDADMGQLGLPMARETLPELPHLIPLYKAVVGDHSDNIPGIKGFGKGTWATLSPAQKNMLHQVVVNCVHLPPDDIRKKVEEFFPTTSLKWFLEPQNRELVATFYKIVNFLPVPQELIDRHTHVGVNNVEAAQKIMQQYMM